MLPFAQRWWKRDPGLVVVAILGASLSFAYYLFYFHTGRLLTYADSVSHPMIARRVFDSPTPGVSQLGGVWPPFPHLAVLPLIWNDWMYRTGTAGAVLSMTCFVLTLTVSYKLARALAISRWVGVLVALIIAVNPNMGYMQSTSMTELPLICSTLVAVYCLVRWIQTERLSFLIGTIAAVVVASATRYEGWALWLAIFFVIMVVTMRRRWSFAQQLDHWIYYLIPAGIFVPIWMAWNQLIIDSGWLGFMHGEYASAGVWVTDTEPTNGNLKVSIETYAYAMAHMAGWPLILIGGCGLLVYVLRTRLSDVALALLVLAFPLPFYVLLLWGGQRPLHVPEISGDAYNIRFALQMVPILALMAGFMVDQIARTVQPVRRWHVVVTAVFVIVGITWATPHSTMTLEEAKWAQTSENSFNESLAMASCLRAAYSGHGRILMETFGNELVLFYSDLPLEEVVYEGSNSGDIWHQALIDPSSYVDWVYMRQTPGAEDKVWHAFHAKAPALADFQLLVETPDARLYGREGVVVTAPNCGRVMAEMPTIHQFVRTRE